MLILDLARTTDRLIALATQAVVPDEFARSQPTVEAPAARTLAAATLEARLVDHEQIGVVADDTGREPEALPVPPGACDALSLAPPSDDREKRGRFHFDLWTPAHAGHR